MRRIDATNDSCRASLPASGSRPVTRPVPLLPQYLVTEGDDRNNAMTSPIDRKTRASSLSSSSERLFSLTSISIPERPIPSSKNVRTNLSEGFTLTERFAWKCNCSSAAIVNRYLHPWHRPSQPAFHGGFAEPGPQYSPAPGGRTGAPQWGHNGACVPSALSSNHGFTGHFGWKGEGSMPCSVWSCEGGGDPEAAPQSGQ